MDIKDRKMGRSGLIRRASFLISGETGCVFTLLWVSLEALYGYPSLRPCPLPTVSLYVSTRPLLKNEKNKQTNKQTNTPEPTGSPSSKYEHRHCCVTFEI